MNKPGPKPRDKPCTISGCDGRQVGQGLCDRHYRRMRKHGDPLITKRIIGDIEARFWSHVDRRGDDECWPWTGAIHTAGYGEFGVGQKVLKAHVWAYEHFVKAVPPGMMLDHVKTRGCTRRDCVNYLRHLEPVTNRENCLRGVRTKLSDEVVAFLYVRWQAGERGADLARMAGVGKQALYKRFRRLATG